MWLEQRTPEELRETISDFDPHILHFAGHGEFSASEGEGQIILQDESGNPAPLPAGDLVLLLKGSRSLRLVFLNSCDGAREGDTSLSSTASQLVSAGIPAVIAMQFEISDDVAIRFAQVVYRQLCNGRAVDAAVAEARLAIKLANSFEWSTPVLYLRTQQTLLFRFDGEPVVPQVQAPHRRQNNAGTPASEQIPDSQSKLVLPLRPSVAEHEVPAATRPPPAQRPPSAQSPLIGSESAISPTKDPVVRTEPSSVAATLSDESDVHTQLKEISGPPRVTGQTGVGGYQVHPEAISTALPQGTQSVTTSDAGQSGAAENRSKPLRDVARVEGAAGVQASDLPGGDLQAKSQVSEWPIVPRDGPSLLGRAPSRREVWPMISVLLVLVALLVPLGRWAFSDARAVRETGVAGVWPIQTSTVASKIVVPNAFDLRRGPEAAKVAIVEFGDFQCPFCKRAEPTVKDLLNKYGKDVMLVWINQPLPFHEHAMDAATALQAAAKQSPDLAWKLHDAMFDNNTALTREDIKNYAGKVGLNIDKLKEDWDDPQIQVEVEEDQKVAAAAGVNAAPIFFINGTEIVGCQASDVFERLIDNEIKEANALLKGGTSLKDVYVKRAEAAVLAAPSEPK